MNTAEINDDFFAVQNNPQVIVAFEFVFEIADIISQLKFDVVAHTEKVIMLFVVSALSRGLCSFRGLSAVWHCV